MKVAAAVAIVLLVACPLSARAQQPGNATGQSAVPAQDGSKPLPADPAAGVAQPKAPKGAAKPGSSSLPATHPHPGAPATDPATIDEMYAPQGAPKEPDHR